ncbi:hypothetical protein [Oerskovia turbata]
MSINIEQVDIDVEDWIDGTTFTQAKVEIHRNPALYADLKPLYDQIAAAEDDLARLTARIAQAQRTSDESSLGEEAATPVVPAGEGALGDEAAEPETVTIARAHLDALYEQAEALYARYDADKETWTLRAMEPAEIQAATADLTVPGEPTKPPKNANPRTQTAYKQRLDAWYKAMAEYTHESKLRIVQAAVVQVDVAGSLKPAPSLEGMRRLATRPGGKKHFDELVLALEAITLQDVVIPAPKSLRPLSDDQVSS